MKIKFAAITILLSGCLFGNVCRADDNSRAQYPWWLSNSYIDFSAAYERYPVSFRHLEPGSPPISIHVPPAGVRVTLFGHNFTERFSAQIVYMRPIKWVTYTDASAAQSSSSITNVGSFTARLTEPLKGPYSMYIEGGLGIVTRARAAIGGQDIVKDANYPTLLLGAGVKYRLNRIWDMQMGGAYLPPNEKFHQPSTAILSAGAVFNMRPLSAERVRENTASDRIFPKHLIQVGAITNRFGTGVNRFVSGGAIPIFWGGLAEVGAGYTVRYKQNVFHTKKVFALDLGLSVGTWQSVGQKTPFMTFSAFPQFTFTFLRSKPADVYLAYSLAGATYITKTLINGHDTGRHFTFQDLMGLGMYAGKQKHINFEVGIGHYSNGNLFPRNAGIKIPLTFSVGYAF